MRRIILITLLGASLAACASSGPQLQTDREYHVEWIGEQPLIDRSRITITLAADGRAHGNAGCNHWFAGYERDGQNLRFAEPGRTRKLCAPALMTQEDAFLKALEQVQRWDFNAIGQLQLWPAQGKPIRLWAN